jgi:hypothetical protein
MLSVIKNKNCYKLFDSLTNCFLCYGSKKNIETLKKDIEYRDPKDSVRNTQLNNNNSIE